MLIPLDYYRILGVPIQATEEAIAQAYHDRQWQKPRREYSEMAIAARKEVLTIAYKVLSSPIRRNEYDSNFLQTKADENLPADLAQAEAETKPLNNPTIEVPADKVIGALLILQELGEYELVLRTAIAYLNSQDFSSLKGGRGDRTQLTIKEDTTLTLALAYLELGREQWQKGEYENAALSGEMGYNLLVADNLYPTVQSEIETDLSKLRPYRILESIAHGEHQPEQKLKAFELLKEMLTQRQGIEGQGKDNSGLNFEQFLCFIQQLRKHLTAKEQQELFEMEAKRPSAVATYLTVYTLLAQGFAHKQPKLILKAQQMLQTLGKKEDVSWEKAICALLLGQTEDANLALKTTKEEKIINLIQDYSQNSPDLLPGLCFYGEKWLHQEVLSQFRDLSSCKLTLKEYFADRQVQNYLEQLCSHREVQKSELKSRAERQTKSKADVKRRRFFSWRKKQQSVKTTQTSPTIAQQPLVNSKELVTAGVAQKNGHRTTATLPKINSPSSSAYYHPVQPQVKRQGKQSHSGQTNPNLLTHKNTAYPRRSPVKKVRHQRFLSPPLKYALLFMAMVWGIGVFGFVLTRMFLKSPPKTAEPAAEVVVPVDKPPVEVPPQPKVVKPPVKPQGMTEALAKQTIEKWLEQKSAAFGTEHKVEALDSILGSSLLKTWRDRAVYYKQIKAHREYEHSVTVRSVNFDAQKPNQAVVEAEVREKADHYQGGNLIPAQSYDENLLVRYHLLRQQDKWLIQKSDVVKSL